MAKYRGVLKDATGNELYPKPDGWYPGDAFSIYGVVCIGFTTSGAAQLFFQIPVNKAIYATGLSVSDLKLTIRTSDGEYMKDGTESYGSNHQVAASQITEIYITESGIRFRIDAQTRWNNASGNAYNNYALAVNVILSGTFT